MLARWTLWPTDDARILHQSILRSGLAPPPKAEKALQGFFVFGPSVVEDEGLVRRAQSRSHMPGREVTIPPSPPIGSPSSGFAPRHMNQVILPNVIPVVVSPIASDE